MKSFKKKAGTVACVLLLMTSLPLISGCSAQGSSSPTSTSAGRSLNISLNVDENITTEVFSNEVLSGDFTEGMQYVDVTDVTIEINGNSYKLEDAIVQEIITAEEIFCYSRLDARNGICKEICESINGLTHFTYHYPEYTIRLIYDIYETPDGQQHLISNMVLYPPNYDPGVYTYFFDGDILRYDLEDWGLNFETKEVSQTGITLLITQSAGQQIGQIELCSFYIGKDETTPVERLNGTRESVYIDHELMMNGTTEVSISWEDTFGSLPCGTYLLILGFHDFYEPSDVHPLMRNFYDSMDYIVAFEVK